MAVAWGAGWLWRGPLLETAGYSREVLDRAGGLLRITLSGDEKFRVFTPLKKIPPELVAAVLAREDQYFYFHVGVNPIALGRAIQSTYIARDKRIGASTITMQLARMRSTRGSKTVTGKMAQMARALWLETFHTKDEILEAYFNLLPFGANIEGVAAASRILYRKGLDQLSADEIQRLVAIPQNPTAHNAHAVAAIRRLPFRAPHFVQAALERSQVNKKSVIHLTMDREVQWLIEQKLKAHVSAHRAMGVKNGAVMVAHAETLEVLGLVGSVDFFNDEIGGQINGAFIKRSPGSTLKPLLFALALDQGVIHPLTLMKDSPTSFGGFDPENFDRKFFGPLSATDALIHSRNVPAVELATRLRQPSFFGFLKTSGVTFADAESHYGLGVVLGSAELTMEELVRLYALLANQGQSSPLRYFLNEKRAQPVRVLSPEAAHLALSMLRANPRTTQARLEMWLRDGVPMAWKTGTSNGFRDAWTVGLVGPYVVAVWLGNFDNEGNVALIGRELAAPLFFSIADGLRGRVAWPPQWVSPVGLNVRKVKVCAVSGHLPGRHCRVLKDVEFIPGKSPITECSVHREILVRRATGERACEESQSVQVRREIFEFWPSDLLQLFRAAGLERQTPPPFAAECRHRENFGAHPQIVSPRREVKYSLRVTSGRESVERIPLSAVADGDATRLHWFVGSSYIGPVEPGKPLFWTPKPGKHIVRVTDDFGRSDTREVEVQVTR